VISETVRRGYSKAVWNLAGRVNGSEPYPPRLDTRV
jgi:hypothetical protein